MTFAPSQSWDADTRTRRLPRLDGTSGPVVVAMVVGAVLHLVWWRFIATSGGDIAAQDAWAEFARAHPGSAYNLGWYGGMHPVSYSVLSPYVMAVIGVRLSMAAAGTLSAGLLAWLIVKTRPAGQRWLPAMYATIALIGNAVSGRVTFALGAVVALVAVCTVFAWPERWTGRPWTRPVRGVVAATAAALATAMSPVAGLFLGLVAGVTWLGGRRAAGYALALPPVAVVALSIWLFPFDGEQPMHWYSAILPVAIGVAIVILVPESWRTVRIGGATYVAAVLLAWLVATPVGTNISRLGLLFGGVVLVAAWGTDRGVSWVGRRHGRRAALVLMVMALITSTAWQIGTAARDAATSAPPTAWSADITPLLAQLDARDAELGRVEVVPTRSHREAAAIAPNVPLARGWNRQADATRNPIFYADTPLTAAAYKKWLHHWAVHYVVLTKAQPDPAAVEEAALVAGGLPYLDRVWSDANWTLYAVRHPTPLVSPPARVIAYDAAELTISTPRAGRIVVRVADSPWLSLVDAEGSSLPSDAGACLSDIWGDSKDQAEPPTAKDKRPDDWLVLHAPAPGVYRIAAPYKLPRGSSCG